MFANEFTQWLWVLVRVLILKNLLLIIIWFAIFSLWIQLLGIESWSSTYMLYSYFWNRRKQEYLNIKGNPDSGEGAM